MFGTKYQLCLVADGQLLRKKTVKPTDNFTRINGQQIYFDTRCFAYQKGRTRYIFVTTENQQLDFIGAPFPYTKDELENLMADKLVKTAIASANGGNYGILTVLLAGIAGAGIGAIVGLIL